MSQDLIKKEEERKMMDRLLSRDEGFQRRKCFKTYREIVEDKYSKSFLLHVAYSCYLLSSFLVVMLPQIMVGGPILFHWHIEHVS